jgi:hypothetical protein
MPWCPECDAYRAPSAVEHGGACRTCGTAVERGGLRSLKVDDELPPVPWSLKVLFVSFLVYLGWRAWQGVDWILGRMG